MIARYYGKTYTQQTLRERCFITREGVSMLGTSHAAESIGMRTSYGITMEFTQEMQGTAEIITEDIRLNTHILKPLKAIMDKM